MSAKCKIINIEGKTNDFDTLPKKNLGQRITKLRKLNNINKKELAKKCELSAETIANIEKERISTPNISTINKLSKALNTTNSYLLNLKEYSENSSGEIINKYRLIKGLTQKELAELCNLDKSTIRDYENNKLSQSKTLDLILELPPN